MADECDDKFDFRRIDPATTAQLANRSFDERVRRVTAYNAPFPLPQDLHNKELATTTAIAKLERNVGTDVADVNAFLKRSQVTSNVGTDWHAAENVDLPGVPDELPFPCDRDGEWDVALRGLIFIMYRYGDKRLPNGDRYLSEEVYDHVLNVLLNMHGPHDPGIEHWECEIGTETVSIPESENHILMIETSRYLTNQLLRQNGRIESRFDNEANGFNEWMLCKLQSFLQNDFIEYNSRPYQHYTTMAIQNLCDFAEDRRVRLAAQMVLDYISAKFAVSSNGLRRSVPFRRLSAHKDSTPLFDNDCDPQTYRFLVLAGVSPLLAELDPPFCVHGGESIMQLAGQGSYRVPDMILDLVLNNDHKSYYQRIRHAGVEIYDSSPQFLISAGGIHTESAYGSPFPTDDGWALPTTLMPSAAGTDRANFIRFVGEGDPIRANTGVAREFACGLNPVIPESYRQCSEQEGPWTFIDASRQCGNHPSLGFYVALYEDRVLEDYALEPRGPIGADVGPTFGFFEAVSAQRCSFDDFKNAIRAQNASRTFTYYTGEYVSVSGKHILFEAEPGGELRWGIHDGSADNDIGTWPLAQGDIMNSDGHSGLVIVDNPSLNQRLVLDMSDHLNPRRYGECTTHSRGFIQSAWRNFELVVPQGDRLVHYWRDMAAQGYPWHRGEELQLPVNLRLAALQRADMGTDPVNQRLAGLERAPDPDPRQLASGVALIQSTLPGVNPGNFELVARTTEGHLYHYTFDASDLSWHGPHAIEVDGQPITGATDEASMIQSSGFGNFELVVPQGDRLVHYWRDMAAQGYPWHRGEELQLPVNLRLAALQRADMGTDPVNQRLAGLERAPDPDPRQLASGVALIQSTLPGVNPGNFELVARTTEGHLYHYTFDASDLSWHGPHAIEVDGQPITGATGKPALIQSAWRNFELVVPQGDRLVHYWRDMAAQGYPWHRGEELQLPVNLRLAALQRADMGTDPVNQRLAGLERAPDPDPRQLASGVALIQSTLPGVNPGNFELVARTTEGHLYHYTFDASDLSWHGPHAIEVDGQPITGVTGV